MISIILAAGTGTRLRPLSYFIPKILLPVRGRPVLDYLLKTMAGCSVSQHYIVASEQREIISDYIEKASVEGVKVVSGLGWETGGDLSLALEQIRPHEDVIVLNGDLITDIDANRIVSFHKTRPSWVTIGTFQISDLEEAKRFGRIEVSEEGRVSSFVEKPRDEAASSPLVNTGFYVFSKELVDDRRSDFLQPRRFRLEDELFPTLASMGRLYACDAAPSFWWDVGTVESYLKAERFLVGSDRVIPP